MAHDNAPPHEIYVREKAILTHQQRKAYDALALPTDKKDKEDAVLRARDWMCANYFDIRTFGAVMSLKEYNCGQVRGPVQMAFARSVEPILPVELSITRMAVATPAEAEKQQGDNRTMGRKHIVPYGLYRAHGFISAKLAEKTGFTRDDLDLFWAALINMFEHDRSAARGEMAARGLYVFEHDSALGNAPAHRLFDTVTVTRRPDGDEANGGSGHAARAFDDYVIAVDEAAVPKGVTLHRML